jgi:Uma2 family endonuclease
MKAVAVLDKVEVQLSVSHLIDEEFERICASNPNLKIEWNANSTRKFTAAQRLDYDDIATTSQALLKNRACGTMRGKVCNSQSGFQMPDRSIQSPDAAYVGYDKLHRLTKEERRHIPEVAPYFIVEVQSTIDSLPKLQEKMVRCVGYGVPLARLVDPGPRQVFIYCAGLAVQRVSGF